MQQEAQERKQWITAVQIQAEKGPKEYTNDYVDLVQQQQRQQKVAIVLKLLLEQERLLG
jgi:hypothetical protein